MNKFGLMLLMVSSSIFCMETENICSIISKAATDLHEFLTENLDNTNKAPAKEFLSSIINELKKQRVNPSVLLELEDNRKKTIYNYKNYCDQERNKNKVLQIAMKNSTKNNWIVPSNEPMFQTLVIFDGNAFIESVGIYADKKDLPAGNTIKTIKLADDNKKYNLFGLLLQCDRPDIVHYLLEESPAKLLSANIEELKNLCDSNDPKLSKDYKAVKELLDESADLSTGINTIIDLKNKTMYALPGLGIAWILRHMLKADFKAARRTIMNRSNAELPVLSINREGICVWFNYDKNLPDQRFNSNTNGTILGVYPSTYLSFYCITKWITNKWCGVVDSVNIKLNINEKIANVLSSKSASEKVVSGVRWARGWREYLSFEYYKKQLIKSLVPYLKDNSRIIEK